MIYEQRQLFRVRLRKLNKCRWKHNQSTLTYVNSSQLNFYARNMVKQTAECRGKSQPTQSGCWPMGSERIQTAVFSYLSKPSSCCQQPSQATWLRQKIGSGQTAAYGKRHVAGLLLDNEWTQLASTRKTELGIATRLLLGREPSQACVPPVGIRAKPSSWAACWQRSQAKQLGRERQGCRMWSVCWDDRAGWQNKQQTVPNVNRNVNRWYAGLLYPPLGKQIQIFRGREEKKEKSLNFQPCA